MDQIFKNFFEFSIDLLVIGTTEARFVAFSPSWVKVLGWSAEELKNKTAFDLIHPDDLQATAERVQKMMANEALISFQNRYLHKDGSYRHLLWNAIYNPDDQLIYGIAKDNTEAYRVEMQLKKSERRLMVAQAMANIGSWELDLSNLSDINSNPLAWSDQVFRIFGYEPGEIEVSNENFFKAVHPEDREKIAKAVQEAVDTGKDYDLEHRIVLPSGEIRYVHERSQVVYDKSISKAKYMTGTVQDITEQKELIEKLLLAQKMESVGRLAGGIAHDFNNMLAIIYGNLEVIQKHVPKTHQAQRYLKSIELAARRATDLVKQLLAYSRRQVLEPEVQQLNQLVIEASGLLKHVIDDEIEFKILLAEEIGLIEVDSSQIIQIIVNLALNARDAMPDGGVMEIETSQVYIEQVPYARLRVTDTGHGMDSETIKEIFEPFFTTKKLGRGTGLGLSTVHGIVAQSGGSISVESNVGKGTTFSVLIPITHKQAPLHTSVAPREIVGIPSDQKCVLVVEDEGELLGLLCETLASAGYKVLQADTGKKGMEIILDRSTEIDMLVTDSKLPGYSGVQLIEKFEELHPGRPKICLSGNPSQELQAKLDISKAEFFQKPFLVSDLLAMVRERLVLDVNLG